MILLIVGSLSENMGINETDARLLEALNLYRENKKHFYTLLKLYNENSNEKIRSIFVKNREKMRKVYLNKSITLELSRQVQKIMIMIYNKKIMKECLI